MPSPPFPWGHRRWSHQASAFVDSELDAAARVRFEQHMAGCTRCQGEVAALRSLKLIVSNMPQVAAPRSFRLTPQMVAAPALLPPRRPVVALRTAQFAAGFAIIALVTVLVIDLTSSSSSQTTTATDLRASAASSANTVPESGKSVAGAATASGGAPLAPATPTPGIVAPGGGGLGGASVPCGSDVQPLTPTGSAPQGPVPVTPCASPTPEAPHTGTAQSVTPAPQAPATGATSASGGPTAQVYSNSAPPPNATSGTPAKATSENGGTSWERPTEWALGGIAAIAMALSAYLMLRRRHA